MTRFRLTGVALFVVFALSVVAVSVAQAEEAPFWSIEGTRLAAGKTHFITIKIYKEVAKETEAGPELEFSTPTAGIAIKCKGLNWPFETGVILGSNAETSGPGGEVDHLTGCTVTGNGEKCTIENKEITTNPLKQSSWRMWKAVKWVKNSYLSSSRLQAQNS